VGGVEGLAGAAGGVVPAGCAEVAGVGGVAGAAGGVVPAGCAETAGVEGLAGAGGCEVSVIFAVGSAGGVGPGEPLVEGASFGGRGAGLSVGAATLDFGGPEAALCSRVSGVGPGDGSDGGCAKCIGAVCSAAVGGGACRRWAGCGGNGGAGRVDGPEVPGMAGADGTGGLAEVGIPAGGEPGGVVSPAGAGDPDGTGSPDDVGGPDGVDVADGMDSPDGVGVPDGVGDPAGGDVVDVVLGGEPGADGRGVLPSRRSSSSTTRSRNSSTWSSW
jgi:hypothetical protein